MKRQCLLALSIALLPLIANSADSIYCPQNQGYISVGMTDSQVINACGTPISRSDSSVQVVMKIPETQLIYTTLNQGAVYPGLTSYYTMWSLPSGSTGTSLHVNIINNKVAGFTINGSSTNAMSICGGTSVQIGDDANRVYSACGTPSLVNNTFISQPVPKSQHPEIWVYQIDQYQSPISLTFVNGQLQSIQ